MTKKLKQFLGRGNIKGHQSLSGTITADPGDMRLGRKCSKPQILDHVSLEPFMRQRPHRLHCLAK